MFKRKPTQERGFSHLSDRTGKPNSVVSDHLSCPSLTLGIERHSPLRVKLRGARPCMRVRICSLHSHLAMGVSREGIRSLSALAFLWSPLSLRTTGVTRYLLFLRPKPGKHVRTFLPIVSSDRLAWSPQTIPHFYVMGIVDGFR